MKNIFKIIILSTFTFVNAQEVVDIKDWRGKYNPGDYYKDVNNLLDQFEGTYQYVEGNTSLTITLKKFVNINNGVYSEDVLAGEWKFIKNGVLQFDNLARINEDLPNKYMHQMCGNSVISNLTRPTCTDCEPNQRRANLALFGKENNRGGFIIIQKIVEAGQPEKIKIYIYYNGVVLQPGQASPPHASVNSGYYTLTKI